VIVQTTKTSETMDTSRGKRAAVGLYERVSIRKPLERPEDGHQDDI